MTRHTVTRPEVRVGGFWLSSIAPRWGELKTSTRARGDWEASFTIATEGKVGHWRHPALVYGARVEVYYGPSIVWAGTLAEPDWDSGEMIAIGACREGESAIALTSGGVATTAPDTAIDAAIARGVVSWTRKDSFGTTAVGTTDDAGGLVTVASVLDAWAQANSSGWRVNRLRQLVIDTPSEVNIDWFISPGSGVMGSADEERVDRVFVRYLSSASGTLATASYPAASPAGGIEKPADITDRGAMTATKAQSIAQGMWQDLQGRSGWTNGLTLARGQVTTQGGTVADLAMIRAGHAMRLLGVPDPRGLSRNLDVVIGDTEYDWTEDTIQLNPVGLAARDTESVLEQVGNLAVDAMAKASATKAPAPFAQAAGVVTVSVSASSGGTAAVVFPANRFTVAPLVFPAKQAGALAKYVPYVVSVTTSGCTIGLFSGDGTTATQSVQVAWEAKQMTATSASG